eukprot:jgi/Mesvir1/21690/Mv04110-RA.1
MGYVPSCMSPQWDAATMEQFPQLCTVALITLSLILITISWWSRWKNSPRLCPPEAPGLPVLGSVLDMAKGPQQFLKDCHEKLGDLFTLRLLTQRMSFVVDPLLLGRMFTAPEREVTFRPAVEQFTWRVFLLPPTLFCPQHMAMITALRNFFAPGVLESHGRTLGAKLLEKFHAWPIEQPVDLVEMVATTMFHASLETLFGARFCKRHGHDAIYREFLTFEGYFELAASPCPHLFLPRFRKARSWLLSAFAASLAAGDFEGTPVEASVLRGVSLPPAVQPCVLLATIWASHANTLPSCFWAVGFLAAPPFTTIRDQVMQGISSGTSVTAPGMVPPGASTSALADGCLRAALDRKHLLRRCVAEVLRLRAAGVDVRMAASDVAMGEFTIPKGHVIAVSPYLSHHDPRVYRNPCTFDPDRWLVPSREGNEARCDTEVSVIDSSSLDGVQTGSSCVAGAGFRGTQARESQKEAATATCPAVAPATVVAGSAGNPPTSLTFGGGAYRCPGRYFAEMEVGLYAALFLQTFEVSLVPPGGCQGPRDGHAAPLAHSDIGACADGSVTTKKDKQTAVKPIADKQTMSAERTGLQGGTIGMQDATGASVRHMGSGVPGGKKTWDSMDDGAGYGWLPPMDATRLVGVKVPKGTCYAILKRR